MSTSTFTDPQTFRQTVALVAEHAKAKLPASINGRLEGAIKLVLAHDVTRLDDGTIEVGSCTDPLKTYLLEGTTCTCQDFTQGKAPEGWCRHRIAAGIAKRVQELLPQSTAVETEAPTGVTPTHPLPEAPASVNVRLTIGGRECQLTLRDHDEVHLLARLEELLQRYPAPPPPPASQGASPRRPEVTGVQEVGWCHKHGVEMTLNQKDGRSWWSHRTAAGWCKGK